MFRFKSQEFSPIHPPPKGRGFLGGFDEKISPFRTQKKSERFLIPQAFNSIFV